MRTFYTCVAAFSTYDYAFKPEREEKFCKIHLETAVFLLWLRKLLAKAICVSSRKATCASSGEAKSAATLMLIGIIPKAALCSLQLIRLAHTLFPNLPPAG